MKNLNAQSFLFNIAGGLILVTVVGYMVREQLRGHTVPRCSERYPSGEQFALQNGKGDLLSAIELQARSGSREWGILKNTKVVKASGAPLGRALQVSLNATDNEDQADQNGLGYVWPVQSLSKGRMACLSYSVLIPRNFKFAEPGYLPGLFGGNSQTALDQRPPVGGAVARMGWVQGGELGVEVRTPAINGAWLGSLRTVQWPTGSWVSVEQEVKLNTLGKADGLIRVWIDGDMKVEGTALDLRGSDQFALSGVVSDVGYARTASEPADFQISPFVVQWQ